MPFTFSHPAIVLPLAKINARYLSTSALVMGSMAPDFEYFIRMRLMQVHGHTPGGIFYYDLPVTICALFIFHWVVRDPLLDHLPDFLRKKYNRFYKMDWFSYARKRWYVILYSALTGIFSHLLWDAFTHAPGYFVQLIPFLQRDLLIFNVSIPSYDLMQLLSTLAGVLVIFLVVIWPNENKLSIRSLQKTAWYGCMILTVAIITLFLREANTQSEFIATSISGMLLGLIVVPILLKLFSSISFLKKGKQQMLKEKADKL